MAAKTFDEVYLVNYSSYDDVNLYEVGCQKCDPSYGYGPIIRKLYILHYVVSGEGLLRIQDKEFAVKEHDIFVIPAHTPSYYEAGENGKYRFSALDVNEIAKSRLDTLAEFISDPFMTELSIVGGFLIAASGISILKIKDFKTMNLLPSLLVPVLFFLIKNIF